MKQELNTFEQQALQLSLKDRSVLIEHLISSLDNIDEQENERLWLQEGNRRFQEYKAGKLESKPANDVFKSVRSKLSKIG